jgi:protein LTV1
MPRRGLGAVPEAAEGHQSDEEAGGVQTATSAAIPMERRKGETAEEKKARKAAVKDSQRHARAQKRELRAAFKQAEKQAARLAATAQPQAAVKLPS